MRADRADGGRHGPRQSAAGPLASSRRQADELRSARDQALERVWQTEADRDRWAELYRLTPVPCLLMDAHGIVRELNEAAAGLLGLRRPDAVGRPVRLFLVNDSRSKLFRHLADCRGASGAVVTEVEVEHRDGRAVPVELRSMRVDGAETLFASTAVDISDRLRAAEERTELLDLQAAARAQAEAKDQFIASLSHELRTPLTPVLAALTALFARHQVPQNMRGLFEMLLRNVVTEARLIDDLLDVARIQRGKLSVVRQPMDVHDAAAHAAEMLAEEARKKGVALVVALEAERHCASGDSLRIRQVFSNLIGNAIKFTPAGGQIAVRSWNRDALLAVEVSDTGMGIAPAAFQHLFKPFEQGSGGHTSTAPSGGLGLGLAIAHGLMELHGGRLIASSAGLGRGARFIVEIDTIAAAGAEPAAPAAPAPEAVPPPRSRLRILLVEDHTDSAEMLADLMGDEGFEVTIASTAAAALAADLEAVDLVVSDVGLPDRSGRDLLRELRQRRPLPAIALSGYGTEADVRASREAGFSAHLTKPVDWPVLLEAIQRIAGAAVPGAVVPT